MPQALRILSQEQRHTLESTYTFLKGSTVYLQAAEAVVCPEDRVRVENLLNFGVLCMSRLVEQFPEIEAWEKRGRA